MRTRRVALTRHGSIACGVGLPIAAACLFAASPASAAGLTGPVSGWSSGNVPSYISMYEYVPAKLATNPPILVVSHYCSGSASGVFGEAQSGGLVAAADKYGFVMVYPQTSNNCWDVGSTKSLTHDGGGDTQAVAEMVTYAIKEHSADANRVYATGTSSGAMMTEALLAVYPDVFKAGAEFSGVPAGCWAASYSASNEWSGPCAGGMVTNTAQEWTTLVQAMDPSYTGRRPRIQLWHGAADTTISPVNQTEAIKEWTGVLGLASTPTTMATVQFNSHSWTHESWTDSCGYTVLDAWTEANGPHGTDANLNATYVIPFLGLDQAGAVDPEVAECTDGGAGTGGTGGNGGSGASGAKDGGTSGPPRDAGSSGTGASGSADASATSGSSTAGAGSGASGSGGQTSGTSTGTSGASGSGSTGSMSGSATSGSSSTGSASAGASPGGSASNESNGSNGSNGGGCSVTPARTNPWSGLAFGGLFAIAAARIGRRRSQARRQGRRSSTARAAAQIYGVNIRHTLAGAVALACMTAASTARAVTSAEFYTPTGYGYGRFEARVLMPAGDGVIGSFFLWKDGSSATGAYWNELDFEKIDANCTLQINSIYGAPSVQHAQVVGSVSTTCSAYHTYAYEWTPSYIAWSVDGQEVRRDTGAAAQAYADNALSTGLQLRFNIWPGNASFGGNFSSSILPVQEYISWVQYSAYTQGTGGGTGTFTLVWRESFENGVPASWAEGNWASPFGLSTDAPGNVTVANGVAVLSLTQDNMPGFAGTPPADMGDLPSVPSSTGPIDAGATNASDSGTATKSPDGGSSGGSTTTGSDSGSGTKEPDGGSSGGSTTGTSSSGTGGGAPTGSTGGSGTASGAVNSGSGGSSGAMGSGSGGNGGTGSTGAGGGATGTSPSGSASGAAPSGGSSNGSAGGCDVAMPGSGSPLGPAIAAAIAIASRIRHRRRRRQPPSAGS